MTATYAPGRFGALDIENHVVKNFHEKPKGDGAMINGGFFILNQMSSNILMVMEPYGKKNLLAIWLKIKS